ARDPSLDKCPLLIALADFHHTVTAMALAESPSNIVEDVMKEDAEHSAQQAEVYSLLVISTDLLEKAWSFGLEQHSTLTGAGGASDDGLLMMLTRCGLTSQCLEVLSVSTVARDSAVTYTNKDGEGLLHIAASAIDFQVCDSAVDLGANVTTKDGKGHTAIMRARNSGASFPTNHYLACHLALKASDLYAVVDAVEGAWLARLTPPYTSAPSPIVLAAVQTLVTKLTQKLQEALAKEDVSQLEESIELVKYSRIQGMPDEARAICTMSRLKLIRGVEAANELELKQAIINAKQYKVSAVLSEELASAEVALKGVVQQKAVTRATEDLQRALDCGDPHQLCRAVVEYTMFL
ncbi:hypothetical protein Pmar_PMAR012117, partial [Perkinsus marinus ATCC 50983]